MLDYSKFIIKPKITKINHDIQDKTFLVNESKELNLEEQFKISHCELLHVGLVCAGYNSNLQFFTMLKSILFYTNNPIHFHILANKLSVKVLSVLIDTWSIPQGKCIKTIKI